MLSHDRQWFGALLSELYADISALSVVGYRWDETDGWTRARAPQTAETPYRHLEFWLDIGDVVRDGSEHKHASKLVYAVRYQPDDDDMSQGILQASVSDVAALLTTWYSSSGARTSFLRATWTAADAGWLVVAVEFTLIYPWRS